jgi:FkbM family methyltransferase
VLDIGSYTGIYSIVAAIIDDDANVIAFDLQPPCVVRTLDNARINGVDVDARHGAIGAGAGTVTYFHGTTDDMISSVASIYRNDEYCPTAAIARCNTVDDILGKEQHTVGLVKIDVEGAEIGVLEGMKETLHVAHPDVIVEVNRFSTLPAVRSRFPPDYRCYQIDETPGSALREVDASSVRIGRNYLFTASILNSDLASHLP